MDEFGPLVESLSKDKCNTFLVGDFIINLLEVNRWNIFHEYLQLLTTNGFYPKIVQPTRFSKKRGTLIDQIFCKFTAETISSHGGIIHTDLSDPFPYFICADVFSKSKAAPRYIQLMKLDNNSIEAFIEDLYQTISKQTFTNDLTVNPNETYNIVENVIQSSHEKHFKPK